MNTYERHLNDQIAALKDRIAQLEATCDCYPEPSDHEAWCRSLRREGDRPAEAHPFQRPTHGRVPADFDNCGAVVEGYRCYGKSYDPIHGGEDDRG